MIYAMTDVGKKRTLNEDSFYFEKTKKGTVLLVSDGMGGHNAGDVASRLAVEAVVEFMQQTDIFSDPETTLRQAVSYANNKIYAAACQNSDYLGMGATIVLAVVCGNCVTVANVGDSRAYLISKNAIRQITKDHSYVYELVKNGVITPEEAKVHPRRNEILKALGNAPEVYPDIFVTEIKRREKLLLCTDGLSGMVDDSQICTVVNQLSSEDACQELIRIANENGGLDNITVVIR